MKTILGFTTGLLLGFMGGILTFSAVTIVTPEVRRVFNEYGRQYDNGEFEAK